MKDRFLYNTKAYNLYYKNKYYERLILFASITR